MEIKDLFSEMPTIETSRVKLRKINAADAADMFEYSSNREVTKYLSYDHNSIEDAETYIQKKTEQYARGECMIWGVEFKETHKYIGACGFTNWDTDNHSAEIAYTLNQSYWGRGIMNEIVAELIHFGFEKMNLNRIEARCWVENDKSVRIMEKNKMKFEGIIREQAYIKGNYRDLKMYSILKKEYEGRKDKSEGKIKAVIFDLDGTLGDTVPLCVEAFRRSIEPLISRTISDEEIIATFGPSEEGTIMQLAPNNYEEGISGYLHYYKQLHDMCPSPFDGIADLLRTLKDAHVRLAMVTGKGEHSTGITLEKFGLTNFFEKIETGHQSGPRKAEGIEAVVDFFHGIDKREIVYVGDAPGDILACRKAGVPVVSVTWANTVAPGELIQLSPDQLFHTISDFSSWISSAI